MVSIACIGVRQHSACLSSANIRISASDFTSITVQVCERRNRFLSSLEILRVLHLTLDAIAMSTVDLIRQALLRPVVLKNVAALKIEHSPFQPSGHASRSL